MNYGIDQLAWGSVYLASVALMSLAIGTLFAAARAFQGVPRTAKFFLGVGLLPLVLGLWMMLLGLLPAFIGKSYFAAFTPAIAAVLILAHRREELGGMLAACSHRIRSILTGSVKESLYFIALAFMASVALVWLIYRAVFLATPYIIDFDASFYIAESLRYAKTLSFHEMGTYKDVAGGILNGSPHNFLWPAYISYGMTWTDSGQIGPGYDLAAILSIRITVFFALAGSLMTLSVLKRKAYIIPLFLLAVMFTPFFDGIIQSHSRDFFRIAGLMLLFGTLNFFSISDYEASLGVMAISFLVGFYIASGHPINLLSAVCIAVPWFFMEIFRKRGLGRLIAVSVAMGLGVAASMYNIFYALIGTGTLDGNSSLYLENILEGSPMLDPYLLSLRSTMAEGTPLLMRPLRIFEQDQLRLIIVAFASCAGYLAIQLFKPSPSKKEPVVFNIVSIFFLLLLGIYAFDFFSWGEHSYSNWLVRNIRYTTHFYFFAVFAIVAIIDYLIGKLGRINLYILILPASLLVLYFAAYYPAGKYDVVEVRKDVYKTTVGLLKSALESKMGKVFTIDSSVTYYTDLTAVLGETFYSRPIIIADTNEQVEEFFKSNGIAIIYLTKSRLRLCWINSQLYKHLMGNVEYEVQESSRAYVFVKL